jgi:hypothetical protein
MLTSLTDPLTLSHQFQTHCFGVLAGDSDQHAFDWVRSCVLVGWSLRPHSHIPSFLSHTSPALITRLSSGLFSASTKVKSQKQLQKRGSLHQKQRCARSSLALFVFGRFALCPHPLTSADGPMVWHLRLCRHITQAQSTIVGCTSPTVAPWRSNDFTSASHVEATSGILKS